MTEVKYQQQYYDAFEQDGENITRSQIRATLDRAIRDEELVGYINYGENLTKGEAFVFDTVVLEQYRRKGVGSGLVKEAMRNMKSHGVKLVRGHVIDKKLFRFWNIHGFHEVPERATVMFAGDIPREYNIVYEHGKDIPAIGRGLMAKPTREEVLAIIQQIDADIKDEAEAHKHYKDLANAAVNLTVSDEANSDIWYGVQSHYELMSAQEGEHLQKLMQMRMKFYERYM